MELPEALTIIVTTSPSCSNPSTEMLERVVGSFALVNGLSQCDLIIVRDATKFKSGIISLQQQQLYEGYIANLRELIASQNHVLTGAGAEVSNTPDVSSDFSASQTKTDSPELSPSSLSPSSESNSSMPFHRARLLVLEHRHGFAHALKRALLETKTPLFMVVQHDRMFLRTFPLRAAVNTMLSHPEQIRYILFPSPATRKYERTMYVRYGLDVCDPKYAFRAEKPVVADTAPATAAAAATADAQADSSCPPASAALHRHGHTSYDSFDAVGARQYAAVSAERLTSDDLVPMVFWYDSTHIAQRQFYLDFVFGTHNPWNKLPVKLGDFIEDTLGHRQRTDIKNNGMAAHATYGTWLLRMPPREPPTCALDAFTRYLDTSEDNDDTSGSPRSASPPQPRREKAEKLEDVGDFLALCLNEDSEHTEQMVHSDGNEHKEDNRNDCDRDTEGGVSYRAVAHAQDAGASVASADVFVSAAEHSSSSAGAVADELFPAAPVAASLTTDAVVAPVATTTPALATAAPTAAADDGASSTAPVAAAAAPAAGPIASPPWWHDVVAHLNGRTFRSQDMRRQLGHPPSALLRSFELAAAAGQTPSP